MHDISMVGPGGTPGAMNSAAANGQHHREVEFKPRPSEQLFDRVELSDRARFLDQLRRSESVRQGVVEQVRRAIDSGEYSIEDRLDPAIERLLEEIAE